MRESTGENAMKEADDRDVWKQSLIALACSIPVYMAPCTYLHAQDDTRPQHGNKEEDENRGNEVKEGTPRWLPVILVSRPFASKVDFLLDRDQERTSEGRVCVDVCPSPHRHAVRILPPGVPQEACVGRIIISNKSVTP
jgi:hypothetical protein